MSFRGGSCLETIGIVVFALLIGAFATSTWLRHRTTGSTEEPGPGPTAAEEQTTVPRLDRSRIRVEVRNGSGIEGAAGRMTEYLREQGFDVVDFGNAERFDHPRTSVIDRGGGEEMAREVATTLQGVPIGAVPADTSVYFDVTVVVGADLDAVLARRAEPVARGWRRWLERITGR